MVLWSTVKSMQALPSCEGLVGEQATMFFRDPAANALKFKSFRESDQLFAK
jgi:extradiol dioxygenase family protein